MKKGIVDIITMGCSKNLVDSEQLLYLFKKNGYDVYHNPIESHGDIAVVNTCGFIGDAKEESIEMILQFAERKTKGKLRKLYVMGCLSQRYAKELPVEIPEVDGWFGKFDYLGIVEECAQFRERPAGYSLETRGKDYERTLTTPKHYAYLKIAEGCNRYCSYCAIPLITGKFTSRPQEEIVDEVRWLVSQGVKEFNVIAQDLSSYGLDLYGEHRLAQLVDEIAQVKGVEWIRLHYTYPTDFPYDLLPVMAKHPNVCKYMDIALQHCSDNMLKKMHRHITREEQDALIARIREEVPGICLRTTLLVGHPGETEEDFNELCEWVKEMKFDRLGAFTYSEEEGTYGALHFKDTVRESTKQRRYEELMELQSGISLEANEARVGSVERVIADSFTDGVLVCRSQGESPEVDGEILVRYDGAALDDVDPYSLIGEFMMVKITGADEYDLIAEPLEIL